MKLVLAGLLVLGTAFATAALTGCNARKEAKARSISKEDPAAKKRANERRFEESAAKALGKFIGRKYANEKIFIIALGGNNWAKYKNDYPAPDLLKKYIRGANVEIGGLPYAPSSGMDPWLEEISCAKYYNQLFKEKTDVKLFVFTLPFFPFDSEEISKLSIWTQVDGPKIALFNTEVHYLAAEIKKGTVAAAVVQRPDLSQADSGKPAPKNLDDAFKARYLLVTPENFGQMFKQYPNIFSKE